MLMSLGLAFEVQPSSMQEPAPQNNELPEDYVQKMAQLKASDILTKKRKGVIIAADTVVIFEHKIMGKPRDKQEALQTLDKLSGNTHTVTTGCCVHDAAQDKKVEFSVSTQVKFGRYPLPILQAYIDTDEPFDKAGSYAIQGIGSFLVEKIQGSYTNVVGLPLQELVDVLLDLDSIGLPCEHARI
jgi:septum formation protein